MCVDLMREMDGDSVDDYDMHNANAASPGIGMLFFSFKPKNIYSARISIEI